MGKALVLKNGASFSANAVTTIEFASIPCTGIAFAHNTYTVSGYDDVTVEYTVTPADTTDSVIWTSSNPDIVTVSNGVMTVNGIGTCTITATCGEFSATATVTVNVAWIAAYADGDAQIIDTVDPYILRIGTNSVRRTACGSGVQATEYVTASLAHPCIKIPHNTAKIKISVTDNSVFTNSSNDHAIFWAKDEFCGNTTYPNVIKPMSSNIFNIRISNPIVFDVPNDGTDAFLVKVRFLSKPDDTIEAMTSAGFNIEFIPAE